MSTEEATVVARVPNGTVVALAAAGFLAHCPACRWTDGYEASKHRARELAEAHTCEVTP